MESKKILIFAPYGAWTVHHQVDAMVGAALMLRGCDVRALICDGIFENCPITKNREFCDRCRDTADSLFSAFHIPLIRISELLKQRDMNDCHQWAEHISIPDMANATFEEAKIGEWVTPAMHSYFMTEILDFKKPDVVNKNRSFLYSGALLTRAFKSLFQSFVPAHLTCYSGFHLYYRVAMEIFKQHDIPVLVHERGAIDNSFLFVENESVHSFRGRFNAWETWKNIPLSLQECEQLKEYIANREQGKNLNSYVVSNFLSDELNIRRQLKIPDNIKIVSLFTTCDWELGLSKLETPMKFDSQVSWLRHIINNFDQKDVFFVIRHHPGIVRKDGFIGKTFLKELFHFNIELAGRENVRVVMPYEKLSSYSLLWNSDAAVIVRSTIGLEAIFRGVGAVSELHSFKSIVGIDHFESTDYKGAIQKAIAKTNTFGIEDLRQAYRASYFIFFRLSDLFKSIGIKDIWAPEIRLKNIEELKDGNDPTLDRICDHVIMGKKLYPLPETSQGDRCLDTETGFLETEVREIQEKRARIQKTTRPTVPGQEPLFAVVRLRHDGRYQPVDTKLYKSIGCSRHKNLEKYEICFSSNSNMTGTLDEIRKVVNGIKAEYIYFGSDQTQVDESLFAETVDFLTKSQNGKYDGVISGAWICERDGSVYNEVFTERNSPREYQELVNHSGLFETPIHLFSLIIWRKSAIISFIDALDVETKSALGFAEAIFNFIICGNGDFNFFKTSIPMVTIFLAPSPQELFAYGEHLIGEENWSDALNLLDLAKNSGCTAPRLDFYRGFAKFRLGKLWEAYALSEAQVIKDQTDQQASDLFYTIKNCVEPLELRYDDVASAIQSVRGALANGQEKFLFEKVKSLPDDAVILEIGALYGRSTVSIAYACVGTRRKFYSIDTFRGMIDGGTNPNGPSFLDVWWANIRRLGLENYVNPLPGLSQEQLASWADKQRPDFVFIDASHHYRHVVKDFEQVYYLVKDGGWIALHDVEPSWPGPWRVWRETGMKLLSEHEYCSTISCGRKEAGKSYVRPTHASTFSYSKEWAKFLENRASDLSNAMKLSIMENEGMTIAADNLEAAERIIASMPDHPSFKHSLGEMIKLEASEDPLLHLWYALTLEKSGNRRMAREQLIEARRNSMPGVNRRIDMHFNRLSDPVEICNHASAKSHQPTTYSGKPMCLFLNTYYQGFLETMYRKVLTLKSENYDHQKQILQAQFFGDSDFYSRGLKTNGWNAADLIVNCYPLQRQWALENSFSGNQLEITIEQIRKTKPTVLYLQDLSMGTKEFLRAVRPYTDLIVGQIACPISPQTDLKGFDIIFTSFPHYVTRFRKLGIMAYYQPLAFDSRVLEGDPAPSRQYPVTFVGGISNAHGKGSAVIEKIARIAPIDFWGYGAGSLPADSVIRKHHHGEVWGLDMFSILRCSQITLNRHVDAAENYANNMRLFEATGCGSLLITDYKDNLNELFDIGKEVIAYRSPEECAAFIQYYTQHPGEAQNIAKAGQQRTLRDHTYLNRMEQTTEIFDRLLRYRRESRLYPLPSKISNGHKAIRFDQITDEMTTAWQSPKIPEKQRGLVQRELAGMYRGQIPLIYQVLTDCLYPHVGPGCSILEIGCASGYYYEVLEYLLNKPIAYTGVDYSESLINMAKNFYSKPEFHMADGSNLPFCDEQFSVAISSCILLHVPNYREHIRETARISQKLVVAHRTPICRRRPTQYMRKEAYGEETVELIFNEDEFISEFKSNDLNLIRSWEYLSNPTEDRFEATYLFQKIK
jgi:SAM-dependent methyltransferase